jgi:flavorubredoxin
VAFIENGSWAPMATKTMQNTLEKCTGLQYAETAVKILSALTEENRKQIVLLAEELSK